METVKQGCRGWKWGGCGSMEREKEFSAGVTEKEGEESHCY